MQKLIPGSQDPRDGATLAPRQPQGFDILGLVAALLVGAIAMLVTRKLQAVSGVEVIEDSPNGEQLAYAPGVPLEM